MSWLKDKIFGSKKVRLGSCQTLNEESAKSSCSLYCHNKLKDFITKGQVIRAAIIGSDIITEVLLSLFRKNTSPTESQYRLWGRPTLSTDGTTSSSNSTNTTKGLIQNTPSPNSLVRYIHI